MVSGVSGGASVDLARSVQALDELLQASQSQVMDLADRLLRVQAQEVAQDESVGQRIDTSA